jgi:hypothetical protein
LDLCLLESAEAALKIVSASPREFDGDASCDLEASHHEADDDLLDLLLNELQDDSDLEPAGESLVAHVVSPSDSFGSFNRPAYISRCDSTQIDICSAGPTIDLDVLEVLLHNLGENSADDSADFEVSTLSTAEVSMVEDMWAAPAHRFS